MSAYLEIRTHHCSFSEFSLMHYNQGTSDLLEQLSLLIYLFLSLPKINYQRLVVEFLLHRWLPLSKMI